MAPPKTQAQIDEEKRQEELRQQQASGEGIWNWIQKHLLPSFGGDDGFGFGDILFWGFVLCGAYFLARTPMGQELIGNLFGEDGKKKVGEFFQNGDLMIAGFMEKMGMGDLAKSIFGDVKEKAINTPSAQEANGLLKHKISPEMADALTKTNGQFDDKKWQSLQADVRAANPDKKLSESFETPATIMMMLTKRPEMTRELVLAAKASNSAGATSIMTQVNAILGDDAKLATLLSPAHRKNTVALLLAVSPLPVKAEALEQLITRVGLNADGTPNAEFKGLLTSLSQAGAAGDIKTALPALLQFAASSPERTNALSELAKTLDVSKADQPTQMAVQLLQHNAAPTVALIQQLGPERTAQFMAVLQSGDANARSNFVLHPDHVRLFKAYADAPTLNISKLPAEMQGPIADLRAAPVTQLTAIAAVQQNAGMSINDIAARYTETQEVTVNGKTTTQTYLSSNKLSAALLSKDERDFLRKTGLGSLAAGLAPGLGVSVDGTFKNLRAILDFGDALGGNPNNKNSDAHSERTRHVVGAITRMLVDQDTSAFAKLDPKEVATFFQDPKNHQAFAQLLQQSDARDFPPQAQALFTAFKTRYGTQQEGIAEVLADEAGAKFLLAQLKDTSPSIMPDWMKSVALKAEGGKVAENADHLIAFSNALKGANVTSAQVVASTTGTAPTRSSSPMRY